MNILGISAFYHDSAAALVRDGEVVAAAQEERFTRKKHDDRFPENAAAYCMREAGIAASGLDAVVFYEKPLLKFERLLETYVAFAPRGLLSFLRAMPVWLQKKLHIPREIDKGLGDYSGPMFFTTHHESHAASAFLPSPFEEAAILTMDGVGEWTTTSWGVGRGNRVELRQEIRFPHSLGLLYSAFTHYCGFRVNSGEYKLMGLAPYGEPCFAGLIREHLLDVRDDGSFRLDQRYFNYGPGLTMTNGRFHRLFGGAPRRPDDPITQRHMDLAASVQLVTEEIVLRLAAHVRRETGLNNLCLAGGVALNCVANGRLLRESGFDGLWIQPAAGDAGGALGAALHHWFHHLGNPRTPRRPDAQHGSCLGPSFSSQEVCEAFDRLGAVYRICRSQGELARMVAGEIAAGKIVGHFAGRAEFGPRALGQRSLLGDPRRQDMQRRMNLAIKFRESFRPFAPAVLSGRQGDYFELEQESPYMLLVAPVRGGRLPPSDGAEALQGLDKLKSVRGELPAVTHVDGSARIQTVRRGDSPRFHAILQAFGELTGCPVLVNTSFNIRGEPIVHSPADAYRCFMFTDMDVLVAEDCILFKADQPPMAGAAEYRRGFHPD
ncbi:MAG: carbamoyltransferase [Chthoniobacterales bacterium]|nr:carbamoyltransferase [Chthoniobacterales bacterium]